MYNTRKTKGTIITASKFMPKPFCGPKDGNFTPTGKRILDLVLEVCKNGLPTTRMAIQMLSTLSCCLPVEGMVNNQHETKDHMQHCLGTRSCLLGITLRQTPSPRCLKKKVLCVNMNGQKTVPCGRKEDHEGNCSSSNISTCSD
jgi:hypothetical protein